VVRGGRCGGAGRACGGAGRACGGAGRACGVARSEWDGQLGDGRVGEPEGSGNGGEERESQDELDEEADQAHPTNRCNHNLYYSASLRRLSGPRVRMHLR